EQLDGHGRSGRLVAAAIHRPHATGACALLEEETAAEQLSGLHRAIIPENGACDKPVAPRAHSLLTSARWLGDLAELVTSETYERQTSVASSPSSPPAGICRGSSSRASTPGSCSSGRRAPGRSRFT